MPDEQHTQASRAQTAPIRRRKVARWIAVAVWAIVIFSASSVPGSAVPGRWGSQAHFIEYAILGLLTYRAFRMHTSRQRAFLWAVALSSGYGVTDEFHQSFVPLRVPDPVDWAVDTTGALIGVTIGTVVESLFRRAESQ